MKQFKFTAIYLLLLVIATSCNNKNTDLAYYELKGDVSECKYFVTDSLDSKIREDIYSQKLLFNKNGSINEVVVMSNNKPIRTKYNYKGKNLHQRIQFNLDSTKTITTYEYAKNLLVKKNVFNSIDETESSVEYSYNNKSCYVKCLGESILFSEEDLYILCKHLIEEIKVVDSEDNTIGAYEFSYNNNKNITKKRYLTNDNVFNTEVYTYDNKLLTQSSLNNSRGDCIWEKTYNYGTHDKISKITTTNSTTNNQQDARYTYDKYGNWTEKHIILSNQIGEKAFIIRRELLYY